MKEKLFENHIRDDETVIAVYEAGKGYVTRIFFSILFISFLGLFLFPIGWFFSLLWLLFFGRISKKNYHVCLTDSRIIIRHGVFGINFDEHDIENFSNVKTGQSVFERDADSNCCHLQIEKTSFHMNSNGRQIPQSINISTIKNGYDLSKRIVSAKKNNKNMVVEIKK